MARTERHVQMGLNTYQKFYEITQRSAKVKTFSEFNDSPYYTAFVKFGSFLVNTKPIYPERFIEYVVRSGVKIDKWCRDEMYENYLLEMIKSEPADGALQRSIKTMMDWSDEKGAPWEHYFKYATTNRVTHDIREGLVSPWLVLNCKSGKEMLTKFSDEQLEIIEPMIDPKFWMRRFSTFPADTALVKELAHEAKIP